MMTIKQAVFAGSSQNVAQKPGALLPEFAFIGRSNVGKSSLINMLCSRKGLAHTSATPGKTQLVNHFLINGQWYLVDLPGYGYARLGKEGRSKLEAVIDNYLTQSKELVQLFVLLDSRHDLQKIDQEFINRLGEEGIPFAIIYTKCDKRGPVSLQAQIDKNSAELLETWEELPPIFKSSSETGAGREEILDYIGKILSTL